MDTSSLVNAIGGINKDSGFYMFSPHAYLHLTAANLAIQHTAYMFNNIRTQIGDEEFANWLQLKDRKSLLNSVNQVFQICFSEKSNRPNQSAIIIMLTIYFKFNFNF